MPPVSSRPLAPEHGDEDGGETSDAEGPTAADEAGPGPAGDGPGARGAEADELASAGDERSPRRSRLVLAGLTALLCAPLLIALVVLRQPRWFPILDLAMTELRVRAVGTSHTPLIGLPGRIGRYAQQQGSHPGPLSFWLLAPVYRLLGASSWAIAVSTVALHGAAVATSLWLARRRAGIGFMLGTALVVALLMRNYGAEFLTQPWNPYMPLLWWFVVLLAVWSVLCRDLVALPIAVFAGSFCAQTHAPYLGIVGGVGLLAVAGALVAYRAAADADERRRVLTWVGGSVVLGAVLWSAPVLDQFRADPGTGNISLLIDHFGSPPEESVGLRNGLKLTLLHLNLWRFVTEQGAAIGSMFPAQKAPAGSTVPGVLLLLVWIGSVVTAWQLRHRRLLRLHLVVGVSLLFSVVSISRIFGQLWYYLMIWAWGVTALLLLAIGWTAVVAFTARRASAAARSDGSNDSDVAADRSPVRLSLTRAGVAGLLAVTVVSSIVFSVDAASTEVPAQPLSETMEVIVPEVVRALNDGDEQYRGQDERYLVNWSDLLYIGAQGVGLVNELDRAGFDVGVVGPWGTAVGRFRVRTPAEATSYVHLANGEEVDVWRAKPGMVELAYLDPRTPAERARFAEVREQVIDELKRDGLDDLLDDVDRNLFAAAIDERISKVAQDGMTEMGDLGLPTAVFVGPPSVLD
jgi:hypothetical protein